MEEIIKQIGNIYYKIQGFTARQWATIATILGVMISATVYLRQHRHRENKA